MPCKMTPLITECPSGAQNLPAGVSLVRSHCSHPSLTQEDKYPRIKSRCGPVGSLCFHYVGIMQSAANINKQRELNYKL